MTKTVLESPASRAEVSDYDWRDLSDAELVEIYREDHADVAFATLVRRHQGRIYQALLGITCDEWIAEELCQRTFVRGAFRLDQLHDPSAVYGWLLSIGRRLAIEELRSPHYKRHNLVETRAEEATAPSADIRAAVLSVLGQMTPSDRSLLILADLEQRSMSELASELDINKSAAKMRLKRARQRFRSLWEASE